MRSYNTLLASGLLVVASVYATPISDSGSSVQAVPASSASASSASPEPTFGITKRRRLHYCEENGTQWMKKIEAQAWQDAAYIVEQARKWDNKADNDLQPLANYWLGNDSINDDVASKFKTAWENQEKIHNPNWIFPEAVVDVWCGGPKNDIERCMANRKNPKDPDGPLISPYATSWVSRGGYWNNYNIALCPRFFQEKQSIQSIMQDMIDKKLDMNDPANYKKAWGFTYVHELFHLDPIISEDAVVDYMYGACNSAKLALWNQCAGPARWIPDYVRDKANYKGWTLRNAENQAFFGAAALWDYRLRQVPVHKSAKAIDNCAFWDPNKTDRANATSNSDGGPDPDAEIEGITLDPVDRTDGTYNYQVPPNPDPAHSPADDGVVPLPDPFTSGPLPSNLATPFAGAEAYFATRTYTSEPTYPPSGSAAVSSSAPSASACEGNQIEGSCTQASLPSETPNQGTESPECNKVDDPSNDYLMFNDDKASKAAGTYCQNLHDAKVVLSANSGSPKAGFQADAAEKGGYVAFTVLFDVGSCDPNTSADNQKVDFGAMSVEDCYQLLYFPIKTVCSKDSTWPDYNKDFSVEGGVWAGKCGLWSVSGLPGSPPGQG